MEDFDYDQEMTNVRTMLREGTKLADFSPDMERELDDLNAIGADVLSALKDVTQKASSHLDRHVERLVNQPESVDGKAAEPPSPYSG